MYIEVPVISILSSGFGLLNITTGIYQEVMYFILISATEGSILAVSILLCRNIATTYALIISISKGNSISRFVLKIARFDFFYFYFIVMDIDCTSA